MIVVRVLLGVTIYLAVILELLIIIIPQNGQHSISLSIENICDPNIRGGRSNIWAISFGRDWDSYHLGWFSGSRVSSFGGTARRTAGCSCVWRLPALNIGFIALQMCRRPPLLRRPTKRPFCASLANISLQTPLHPCRWLATHGNYKTPPHIVCRNYTPHRASISLLIIYSGKIYTNKDGLPIIQLRERAVTNPLALATSLCTPTTSGLHSHRTPTN